MMTPGVESETEEAEEEGAERERSGQDYEAEQVLDCIVHSDESMEYLIKFKGFAQPEWTAAANAYGCKKLIRQYEDV
jgi:hypothetical protein